MLAKYLKVISNMKLRQNKLVLMDLIPRKINHRLPYSILKIKNNIKNGQKYWRKN